MMYPRFVPYSSTPTRCPDSDLDDPTPVARPVHALTPALPRPALKSVRRGPQNDSGTPSRRTPDPSPADPPVTPGTPEEGYARTTTPKTPARQGPPRPALTVSTRSTQRERPPPSSSEMDCGPAPATPPQRS